MPMVAKPFSHHQCFASRMFQGEKHRQVIPEMAIQQEVVPHELVADLAHALPLFRVAQKVANSIRGP